eukprot:969312-Prymnesium_polylepis.1
MVVRMGRRSFGGNERPAVVLVLNDQQRVGSPNDCCWSFGWKGGRRRSAVGGRRLSARSPCVRACVRACAGGGACDSQGGAGAPRAGERQGPRGQGRRQGQGTQRRRAA